MNYQDRQTATGQEDGGAGDELTKTNGRARRGRGRRGGEEEDDSYPAPADIQSVGMIALGQINLILG